MSVFDFLRGVARYRIEVGNTEELLNAIKKDASVKSLVIGKDGTLSFFCFYVEQDVVENAIKKTNGRIINKKVRGLPCFAERLLHRTGLALGFLLSALLIALSTLFVWEIRVEGNEKLSESQVVEMLERAGFREGMLKKRVDVKKVTDRLLINEDAVSWMAINFDGTVARVEMKEAKIATPVPKKENVNLVASANGIILRVDAHEGGTKVSKGEAVVKGQLLVSAFVDKRTGGSMLRGARGFVWANTERCICVTVPLEQKEKKYTGKERHTYGITFLGKTVYVSNPLSERWELVEYLHSRDKMTLFGKFVLPVTIKTAVSREYTEKNLRRTKQQALSLARQTAADRLYEISQGFVQLDINEQYSVEGNNLVYECRFSGVENIAKELEFELS